MRLLIPVIATRPTFWANALTGRPLNPGQRRRQHVGAQTPRDGVPVGGTVDDLADGEDVRRGLRHDHQHDDEHRDDRADREGRQAEVERRGELERLGLGDSAEVGHAERDRDQRAEDQAEQDRNPAEEGREEPVDRDDEEQGESGETDVARRPNSSLLAPSPAHRNDTGSREIPMTVMTTPVTTGGKKSSLVNTGARRNATAPATMTAVAAVPVLAVGLALGSTSTLHPADGAAPPHATAGPAPPCPRGPGPDRRPDRRHPRRGRCSPTCRSSGPAASWPPPACSCSA
jgi:hypothetical protein